MKRTLRNIARSLSPKLWGVLVLWNGRRRESLEWKTRIADAVASPDNARLPRVHNAGRVEGHYQIMHNGLKVRTHGYYGREITRLLKSNRGCHEPQEEAVFAEIIKTLQSGATMVECGAYWGFYSMWFLRAVASSRAYLIEPLPENLTVGQENFRANGLEGNFTNAFVGAKSRANEKGPATLTIDDFVEQHGLAELDILHADIQGAELDMLIGARDFLGKHRVKYVFLSTHSVELHRQCRGYLCARGYVELVSIDLPESHSVDGILVFCSPRIPFPSIRLPIRRVQIHR